MRCIVLPDAPSVFDEAARRMVSCIVRVQESGRPCSIALAGGSTPRDVYARLVPASAIDPAGLRLFWGDERAVPPQDPRSNQRMVRQAWLDHVPIPPECIHPMRGDAPQLEEAAREYEALLETQLGSPPRFDLVLLGLGTDAHTASLFPGSDAIEELHHTVAVTRAPDGTRRLTLTPPALRATAMLLFVVTGSRKARALRQVLHGATEPLRFPPHALVRGKPLYLVDREAAGDRLA